MKKSTGIAWSVVNVLLLAGTVLVNGLANSLPINGLSTGEISDRYTNLFVPAGFTFAIWGVIYLLLAVFVFVALAGAFRGREATLGAIGRIGFWFALSCAANMGWILAWHHLRIGLSLLIMLVLLTSLLAIYRRLGIGRSPVPLRERLAIHLPFSVYLGWISVATIANASAVLVDAGWDRFGLPETVWVTIAISMALVLSAVMLHRRTDFAYVAVVLWAFYGIAMKNRALEGPDRAYVASTATAALAALAAALFFILLRQLKKAPEGP
jgi:hypothetical protein